VTGIGLPSDIAGTTGYAFSYHSGNLAQALMKTMSLPTKASPPAPVPAVIFYDYGTYTFHHARPTFLPPGCAPTLPPLSSILDGIWKSSIVTDSGTGHRPQIDPNPKPNGPTVNCGEARYLQHVVGVLERTVEAADIPDSITSYTQYALPFGETDTDNSRNAQTLTVALLPEDAAGNRRAALCANMSETGGWVEISEQGGEGIWDDHGRSRGFRGWPGRGRGAAQRA
jgi:hypothetical protein